MLRSILVLTIALSILAVPVLAGVKVGDKAPDFTLPGIDGSTIKLSNFTNKPTILVFWYSNCSHCRIDTPVLQKVYAALHGKGLNVVGVSADMDKDTADGFARRLGLKYPNAYIGGGDGRRVLTDYGITAVPVTFIIGADGKIKQRYIGEVEEKTLRDEAAKLGIKG